MVIQFVCRISRLLSAVLIGWMLISSQLLRDSALAQTTPFYQDKTIRIIVGFTAGGLYDQYARILARHMPKYIPGKPHIIVQNIPDAGSLTATHYVLCSVTPPGSPVG